MADVVAAVDEVAVNSLVRVEEEEEEEEEEAETETVSALGFFARGLEAVAGVDAAAETAGAETGADAVVVVDADADFDALTIL